MALEMRRFEAEVYCRTILMRGVVESHQRLTDLVNQVDPYLGMTEVYTYPYNTGAVAALERHQQGIINKSSIVMLAELEPTTTTPETALASQMRIQKTPNRIVAFTDDFAISADIHITEGATMATFLTMSQSRFVPFTNATVHPTQPGTQLTVFERPFLLINREQVVYLGADNEQTSDDQTQA
jgi:hypothetical protein